jgi:mRNA interferase RelE/StbE
MKVLIDKSFDKDVSKIDDKKIRLSIVALIEEVQKAKNLSDITNIKKLKGHKSAYRIRMGEYRIGVFHKSGTVEFIRFLHRSNVYNKFP